jgi:hypothetical protein
MLRMLADGMGGVAITSVWSLCCANWRPLRVNVQAIRLRDAVEVVAGDSSFASGGDFIVEEDSEPVPDTSSESDKYLLVDSDDENIPGMRQTTR